MELHNTVEDTVISRVDEVFKAVNDEGTTEHFCTCSQCRMDIICYALNRLRPHYIISNRGASRTQWESFEQQQQTADITSVIYEGLKQVNHHQRPHSAHPDEGDEADHNLKHPVFNVPTIMGRLFNGNNFSPLSDGKVELLWNGEPVPMKNGNWQNPSQLVANAEGTFSFWPAPAKASRVNNHKIFEYTLRVTSPEFEILNHHFKIPVASEIQAAASFTLDRTFKLPDLYMFPPGEADYQD